MKILGSDITIYGADEQGKAVVPFTAGSKISYELMRRHDITLSFVSDTYITILKGDYVEHDNIRYTVMADYIPDGEVGRYKYEVEFHAPEILFQNLPFFYVNAGVIEAEWSLTANPSVFIDAVIACIAQHTGETWVKGTITPVDPISLSFSEVSIFDALTAIAEACETEWYVRGTTIYLTRCEEGVAATLTEGLSVKTITPKDTKEDFCNRVFAFGSTRNLSRTYRNADTDTAELRRRLKMPAGVPYVDSAALQAITNPAPGQIVARVKIFEEVYPKIVCAIASVHGTPSTDQEGVAYMIYSIRQNEIIWDNNYLTTEPLSVHFEDGALAGRDFEVFANDNPALIRLPRSKSDECKRIADSLPVADPVTEFTVNWKQNAQGWLAALNGFDSPEPTLADAISKHTIAMAALSDYEVSHELVHLSILVMASNEWTDAADAWYAVEGGNHWFELIPKSDTIYIPNTVLRPQIGDEFVLYNYDISLVDDQLVPAAELQLQAVAQAWVDELDKDTNAYNVQTMAAYCQTHSLVFDFGQRINIVSDRFAGGSRLSRIIGYERTLANPHDCQYIIGDASRYSRIGALESKVDEIEYQQYIKEHSTGQMPRILRTVDNITPSENNVLSSVRSLKTFVKRSATGATIEGNGKTFGIDVDADGNLVFHGNIYATGSVSAQGVGTGGGGTSYNRLDTWAAYIPGTTDTWVLSALLGHDLHTRVTALEEDTPNVVWGVPTTDYVPLTVNDISRQLSVHGHGHTFDSLASKPTTIAGYGITDSLIYEGDARLTNSRPASDVYAWAKAASKPSYSYTEVGAAAASHVHAAATTSVAGFMSTTDKSKLDGIEAQANKYIHPTNTSRSAGGASHFITAFTSDTLGHVTGITTAAMAKADVEAVLVGNSITSHYHDDRYFKKDELFTKEGSGTEADPYRIKANFPFYGVSSVAALGIGVGGGGAAYDRLDDWGDYTAEKAGWVLSALLGADLHSRVGALEASTPNIAFGVPTTQYVALTINSTTRSLSVDGHTHTKAGITDFAHTHTKSQITDFPTALSAFTNDLGNYGGFLTGITKAMVEAVLTGGITSHSHSYQAPLTGTGFVVSTGGVISYDTNTYSLSNHTHGYASTVKIGTTSYNAASNIVSLPAYPTTLPASDVSAWAKAATKPTYNTSEVGEDTNLYFTTARVLATTLGAITASDLALQEGITLSVAMSRIQGQINARALLAGSTSQDFSAKALTLAGAITGATSGAFTTHIDIGNARIMWDSANNALKVINKNLTDTVNLYATGSSSALGIGVGGGGTAYDRLDTWASYDSGKAGWVLSAALGYDLHDRVSTLESSTPNVAWGVAGSGYIPLAVNSVSHQLSTYGHTHTKSSITDFAHTHDDRYYTETEVGDLFAGTTAISGYNKSNWDGVYTAFNAMQVGGRNLLKNSKTGIQATGSDFPTYTTPSFAINAEGYGELTVTSNNVGGATNQQYWYWWLQSFFSEYPKQGEYYTYSFEYKTNCDSPSIWIDMRSPVVSKKLTLVNTNDAWKKASIVCKWDALTTQNVSLAGVNLGQIGAGLYVSLRKFKLEKGNIATDWTPAPEDVDASIATVQTNLTTHAGLTNNPHAVTKTQVGLSNVENTALSTWAGSGNITALGTVTSGTWSANTIAVTKGGTGKTSVAANSMLYATAANTYGEVATTAFGRGLLSAASGTEVSGLYATTATKLATSRTIFGQSFDGTANVTGAMSATTAILSNLTANKIPYHTAAGLTDSPIAVTGNDVSTAGNLTLSSADGTFMQIGAGRLVWDNTNNAIKVIKADGTAANFYATGSNSAQGIGTGGGGSSYNMISDWSQYVAGSELWVVSAELINSLRTSVTSHIGDSTHATAGEKSNWNAAYSHSLVTGGVHMTSTDRSQLTTAYNFANGFATSYPDLTAIEAITGTSGLLKKTAANTWSLDTNTYITGITKAMVEAVLTGGITSHTHAYVSTSGGTITGALTIAHNPFTGTPSLRIGSGRYVDLTGNSITFDMSGDTGGWASNILSVKDPVGTTVGFGIHGGVGGIMYYFMGGTYSAPIVKLFPADRFAIIKSGDITPAANNTYNLGSTASKWANVHATVFTENGTVLSSKYAAIAGASTQDFGTKNLTVAGTASVTGLLTASGNIATANVDGAYMQIGPIKILYDATNGAIRVEGNIYATGSATAFGIGGGAGGGGLITNVYGSAGFGGTYSDVDLSSTFNAYAINSLYTALQGKAASDHSHAAASALVSGMVTTGTQSFKGVKGFLDGFDCTAAANFRTSLKVLNNAENGWVTFAERYVAGQESEAVINLMNIGSIYSAYQGESITSYDEENIKVIHHWDNVYEQNVVVNGYVDAAKVAPGIALARANKFATMGEKLNYQPGMIRSGQIPRKVVVIGNSMTAHGYNASLGWTVSDFREMAASKPDTGWITLIKKHLVTLNPGVKVYKSNGAAWEAQTLGSKAYSTIQGVAVWEATETGPATTAYTLDTILDSDVDVVIVQLYENIPDTTGNAANCATLSVDYQNLYASIRAKCPNARLYQFCGFWQTEGKGTAVMTACARANVEPIHAPVLMWPRTGASQYPDIFKCVAGDIIRDANNNQLCTVSASVAGHPNDLGFGVMAAYTIFKLYNSGGVLNDYLTRFILKVNAPNGVADWMDATTDVTGDLYYDASVTTLAGFQAAYAPYLKYMVLGGKYSATVKLPTAAGGTSWAAAHSFLEIKHSGIVGNNYKPAIQRIVSGNDAARYSVERKVVLSSNAIAYGDFYIVQ
jgi:hypothetical protein